MKPIYLIQNCKAESAGTIVDYCKDRQLEFKVVENHDNAPLPKADDCEAAIVLGCPLTVNRYLERDDLKSLWAFMSAAIRRDLPLLGICFGGQMLAKILGARVDKNEIKEIGMYDIRLTSAGQADPLFAGLDQTFRAFHWHGDTFRIPSGATLLAESDDCKNQAFRKGNAIGLQFHLEPIPTEVPLWCDSYKSELEEVGKTKEQIITDLESHFETLKAANYQLLDNFLK